MLLATLTVVASLAVQGVAGTLVLFLNFIFTNSRYIFGMRRVGVPSTD